MMFFNISCFVLLLCALLPSAQAEVRVFVRNGEGTAWIHYECTSGEVIRAFALDVTVDRGEIVGISDFMRGESRAGAVGYGIFPAAFRDHITVGSDVGVNWDAPDYTPLAAVEDDPAGTLPGLYSKGVTLEFGALWDPAVPEAAPAPSGTLCGLRLSGPANVGIAPNTSRGGVVPAGSESVNTLFTGAPVGPLISSFQVVEGFVFIEFEGGRLEASPSLGGPWTELITDEGEYIEPSQTAGSRFYRVRARLNF